MRVALLTREYPPDVYGGAGVHVEHLAAELRSRVDLAVHCWGDPRPEPWVRAHRPWAELAEPMPEAAALRALSIDLSMAGAVKGAELVHSHTWYANLGGHLAGLAWDVPHVMTSHSLEPLRPWKAEQLGGGYAISSYCERTAVMGAAAVIAVSEGMRSDLLGCYPELPPERVHVIHNGVDPDAYAPRPDPAALARLGVDPGRPYVLWLGRVTRQKGLDHLLRAALRLDRRHQVVVAAGAADTADYAAEVAEAAGRVRADRGRLVWIDGILPREDTVALYTGAAAFCCSSVYEPFGLVNLEAMACETAVVATAVGGIPEIVVEAETGYLVPLDPDRPAVFEAALAERLERLLDDPAEAGRMGRAGRSRVLDRFSWPRIAARTVELYRALLG